MEISRFETVREPKGLTRDYVYETMKGRIMTLKLEPGRFISEKEAMEMLQVSRTPIREAFVKLAQDELIETVPQRGSFVTHIDLERVEESRFARETLEAAVMRQACERLNAEQALQLQHALRLQELCVEQRNFERLYELDTEFHRVILAGCGKIRTWQLLQQLSTHYNRIRYLRLAVNSDWLTILADHRAIVKALQKRDPAAAEQAMREHLSRVTFEKEELLLQYPGYFN